MSVKQDVLEFIYSHGNVDGDHHKAWVIDQIVRILTGTPKAYKKWVEHYCTGEDGPNTYEWSEGTPP